MARAMSASAEWKPKAILVRRRMRVFSPLSTRAFDLLACEREGVDPLTATRSQVALFVRDLRTRPSKRGAARAHKVRIYASIVHRRIDHKSPF
jgi:hypothetical protein